MILSLKSGSPLYISKKLFDVSVIEGVTYDIEENIKNDSKMSLENLNKALSRAILAEEYERCYYFFRVANF